MFALTKKIKMFLAVMSLISIINVPGYADTLTECKGAKVDLNLSINNFDDKLVSLDVPKEVRDSVAKIYSEHPDAKVTISNTDGLTVNGTGSSWGSYRTYKNHKLRDWIITTTASYPSQQIKKNVSAAYYKDNICWTLAGAIAGSFAPFLSYGVTAIQAIANSPTNPSPSGSDILEVAPTYTCKEKFTYVYVGSQYFLGTKSYCSTINSLYWRLYLANQHKNYTKTFTYNKQFKTPSYDSPDSKAIIYYGNGGYLETQPSINIGGYTFALT